MSDRTILNPSNANSLNGLFNGSTPISVSTLTVGFPPNDTVLSSNAPGSLIVSGTLTTTNNITAEGGVCTLGVSTGATTLTSNAGGSLLVGGTVTTTGGITAQNGIITMGEGTDSVELSVNAGGSLLVGGTITTSGGLTAENGTCVLGLGADSVELTGTNGILTVDGECNATTFRGGIIFHIIEGLNPGTLSPSSGYLFPSMEIPNFVGSASSAYLISCNNSPSSPPVYLPVVFTISYVSNDGTNTYVDITVMNVSTTTSYGAIFDVSIIAMN